MTASEALNIILNSKRAKINSWTLINVFVMGSFLVNCQGKYPGSQIKILLTLAK